MDKVNVLLQRGLALQLHIAIALWTVDGLGAMSKLNVMLQSALVLHLDLAVTLWALEQLHLGPVLLDGHFPSRIRAFVLHHLHFLLFNVLFAVLTVVDPKTDQGEEDLSTLVTGKLVPETSLLVQLQLCHGEVCLQNGAQILVSRM